LIVPNGSFYNMENTKQHLEHLAEMRSLMERSTRFLSLSGLSGIWAGLCAVAGASIIYRYLGMRPFAVGGKYDYYERAIQSGRWGGNYISVFIWLALAIVVAALAGGLFFTWRKAQQKGHKVWDASSRRLLWALTVPLAAGGIVCLGLLLRGFVSLLAPLTLIFYGLALVSGSKHTLRDVETLGILEIVLGLTGIFYPGYGLELWTLGFGVLHIVYGAVMYFKYEKGAA
jgi:hypothetical protein